MRISSNGTAIAIWHTSTTGIDSIISDTLTISTNVWQTTKTVITGSTSQFYNYPKVAIDASGNATAAWYSYQLNGGNYQHVQVSTSSLYSGATSWLSSTTLSHDGMVNPASLKINIHSDVLGNCLAIWTNSYDGLTYSVESALKLSGGAWPTTNNITNPESPTIYSIDISTALSQELILCVLMAFDGISSISIQSHEANPANPFILNWTPINSISNGNKAFPKCSLSFSGTSFNAGAVWLSFNGTHNVLMASAGTAPVVIPPSSINITQSVNNFGVHQDYYNTITWGASTDPNLMLYNIYRNGVYFASVDPSVLSFIDHNQINGGSYTYSITAFTTDYLQSAMVTGTLP